MAVNSIRELSKRSELIRTALLVFGAYSVSFVAMEIIQERVLAHLSVRMFGYFAINAVFISFAYILVFVLEKIFGFTSRVTLVELSDINHPLLKSSLKNVPEHSSTQWPCQISPPLPQTASAPRCSSSVPEPSTTT